MPNCGDGTASIVSFVKGVGMRFCRELAGEALAGLIEASMIVGQG